MTSSAQPRAEAFAVDRRGPDLLIRRPGEAEPPGGPASVPGHAFVRVSAAAAAEPGLVTALPSLLHRHVVTGGDVGVVRIGLPGLGTDALVPQALADALDVEIFAPDGDFCADPGAALYAAGGWRHFRPGTAPSPGGHRHPVPPWEAGLPAEAITVGGVVLEPVPAGVRVRGTTERPATPGGPAFAVPADPAAARIVVGAGGRVPLPAEAAAAVARLPEVPTQLVVLPSAARTSAWLREFATTLGRDVVVAAAPAGGFGPFASLLRQRPDGGQVVAEVAPPPGRWQRRGPTGYRLGVVEADVVPSGLALRTGRPDPAAARPPSDPRGWTLHLGTPGERLTPELLMAAEEVLGELTPPARAAARLRLAGTLDDSARTLLSIRSPTAVRGTRAAAGSRPRTASDRVPPPGSVAAQGVPHGEDPRMGTPTHPGAAPVRGPEARPAVPGGVGSRRDAAPQPASASRPEVVAGRSVLPPAVPGGEGPRPDPAPVPAISGEATVGIPRPPQSSAPAGVPAISGEATVGISRSLQSSAPAGVPAISGEATVGIPRSPQSPAPVGVPATSGAGAPAGERPQPGPLAPPALLVSGPPVSTVSGAPAPLPEPGPAGPAEAEPAELPEPEPAPQETPVVERPVVSGEELVVADRASTPAEQARFTAAAGEAYGEALATVNAALATWPSMRQEEARAKADYVAVCLYLGGGAGGAADLGTAVRSGSAGEVDGQLPCLVSGLRRLPTHRRAVLRQGRAGQPPEGAAAPGTVLTEPGFLVGSTDLDVTVPDAGLDVLIWPASARRTSELRIGPPVNEVVFFAGARFKALAVRTVEPGPEPADDAPAAPRVAALFRELAPGEQASGELDERDLAALAKLDQVLERRHRGVLRVVDEPGVVARMTTSLLEWRADTAARATANHTATLAS